MTSLSATSRQRATARAWATDLPEQAQTTPTDLAHRDGVAIPKSLALGGIGESTW